MQTKLITAAILLSITQSALPRGTKSAQPRSYAITHVALPGEGRGDYLAVDAQARRLYVSHTAAVHILDLDTLIPLAELDGFGKAHGIAIDRVSGHGFATDGVLNQVVMFDLTTNKPIRAIKVGKNPDSILFDVASKMIFVFNGATKDASVIDPASGEIVATIPLGDKPEFSVSDGKGQIWVNLEETAAIASIDTKSMSVSARWPLADCEGPAGIALDQVNRRLFSGCGNRSLKVVNADTGAVVAAVPIGEDADGVVYDAGGKRIFAANRDGTMTIIRQSGPDHYSVERTLRTEVYAKTIAIDPTTRRLFSSTADLVWPPKTPGETELPLPTAKSGSFRLLIISQK